MQTMRIYAVNCDQGRGERLLAAAAPLNLDMVLVPSPRADDPEVLSRGAKCLEIKSSYPTGIAATLGHLRAMEQLVRDKQPWGIVIEDDVRFHIDFNDIVKRLERSVYDADIVSLGYVNMPSGRVETIDGISLIKNVGLSNPWGAQCYMITYQYACRLLNVFSGHDLYEPYSGHFVTDWVLFDPILGCRRHTLTTPIAVEGPNEQTIAGSANKPDLWSILDRSAYHL
jgi:GR25 family glycosyltransferase involved in LPS biosynthesis